MSQRSPHSFIVNSCSCRGKVCGAVLHEGDGLRLPIIACSVNLHGVCVPVIVGGGGALVAIIGGWLTNGSCAVDSAVNGASTIDHLEDINFATLRPSGSVTHTVTQHPESWPHALGIRCWVTTGTDGRLYLHDLAGRWCEGSYRFDPT